MINLISYSWDPWPTASSDRLLTCSMSSDACNLASSSRLTCAACSSPLSSWTQTHTHTHTYRLSSNCEEVENCTSVPTTSQHHFPTRILPRNYTNIRIHAHTRLTHTSPTQTCTLTMEQGFRIHIIGRLNIHLRGPSCEEVENCTSQLPTTSQHHILARICPRNCMNVNAHNQLPVFYKPVNSHQL